MSLIMRLKQSSTMFAAHLIAIKPQQLPSEMTVYVRTGHVSRVINPLWAAGTLKPQSNGPSYSNAVTGTLAVDGWAVTFGTASRGLGGLYSPIHQRLCSYAYGALQICL